MQTTDTNVTLSQRAGLRTARLRQTWCIKPSALALHEMSLRAMCDAIEEFCRLQGLVHDDAAEMVLREDLTPGQKAWLEEFCDCWERQEDLEATAVALGTKGFGGVVYLGGQAHG